MVNALKAEAGRWRPLKDGRAGRQAAIRAVRGKEAKGRKPTDWHCHCKFSTPRPPTDNHAEGNAGMAEPPGETWKALDPGVG